MLEAENRGDGLLLNYTGDGKGKTTAALGTVLRALGWGWRVAVIQLVKSPEFETGEKRFFAQYFPDMIFEQYGYGLLWRKGDHAAAAQTGWNRVAELLLEFPGELLVIDELNNALHAGLLPVGQVAAALTGRRRGLNVVVTGRHSPEEIRAVSDLISEVREIKHPYRDGIPARPGLDY